MPVSTVIDATSEPEVVFTAYAEDGERAGTVEVYLAEAPDGWYTSIILAVGEGTSLIVRDEFLAVDRDEALDAAVLRANDAANEHGYTAEV